VLSNRLFLTIATATAPAVWGTTYLVTTQLLPADRPLLAATMRALPAGLLIVAVTRQLPRGQWWWKSFVLGTLNIGAFFALLFIAAYRLPGGVAATIGAIQPLIVTALAVRMLGEAPTPRRVVAGLAGVAGVALLVFQAPSGLDLPGVIAALGGAVVMATGVVLAKRWGQPAPPLVTTSWQLVAGGLVLLPLAIYVEGVPTQPLTGGNLAGYVYLGLIGTALAYTLWFRGIQLLPVTSVAFLGLLSPVVAVVGGVAVLHQSLNAGQLVGTAVILGAILAANARPSLAGVAGRDHAASQGVADHRERGNRSAGGVVQAQVVGVQGVNREQVPVVLVAGRRGGAVILLVAEVVDHVEGTLRRVPGGSGAGVQAGDVCGDAQQEPVPEAGRGGRVGVETGDGVAHGACGRPEPGQLG
jgi:probable blue pigment (indigoidine) exporter